MYRVRITDFFNKFALMGFYSISEREYLRVKLTR